METRQRAGGEEGQSIVLIGVMMVGLVAILGLVLDGGMLLVERRSIQNAADSAATAAATDLLQGHSVVTATSSALYYAARNGYDNNGTSNRVTVSIPPVSGERAGNSQFAQIAITKTLRTFFIQVAYSGLSVVSTSATAGITSAPVPFSILVLNRTACGSLTVDNNGHIGDGDDAHRGAIMVDSSCSTALNVGGNGTVLASSVGVVGNYHLDNNGIITPTPQTGLAVVPDPLANLAPPDLSGLTVRNGTPANPSTLQISNNQTLTLYPGIYYGGISVSNNGTANLQPGTYIIAGGGFYVGNNGIVNGTGVFIYNTKDQTNPNGAGAYGSLDFENNGTVNLSPPSSGPYKGLMFFQDRNNTSPFTISNNGHSTGGTIYAPSAACTLANNAVTYFGTQAICDTMHISNNATIDNEFQPDQVYQVASSTLTE